MTNQVVMQNKSLAKQKIFTLASPILILILGHFSAQYFTALWGNWAWPGVFCVYWGCMLGMVSLYGGMKRVKGWFAKPIGSRWWLVLAVLIGLSAFPILFFPNLDVLNSIPMIAAWFLFAIINSTCEELYWRGFLLDETAELPFHIGKIYTSLLFIAMHPLMLGVFSKMQSFDPDNPFALLPFLMILTLITVVYCLIYLKTRSLRWPILSHFLTDLGNLSIFVFMNLLTIG
jgi:membrane protease YdiL (CAAX protease family)